MAKEYNYRTSLAQKEKGDMAEKSEPRYIQVSINSINLLPLPAASTSLPQGEPSNERDSEQAYRTHSPWDIYDSP